MYCVALRSCRVGCEKASSRYSLKAITRRLRVKSSRTDWCSPTSVSLTVGGRSAMRRDSKLVRGDRDRDRLLLRVAAVLLADAELQHALDLVAAGLVRGRLDREGELLLAERLRVALRL